MESTPVDAASCHIRCQVPAEGLQATRGGYAHVVIAVDREANVDGLWVSLAFEVARQRDP
jgi:hypothetical protein